MTGSSADNRAATAGRTKRWGAALAAGTLLATGLVMVPGTASANGDCPSYWAADTGSWSGSPAAGGTGTAQDPYKVGSESDLTELQYCPDQHFSQIADLSLAPDWLPMQGQGVADGDPFTGVYDGAGFEIAGLSVNTPDEDNVGLFRVISAAGRVTDLTLTGVNIVGRDGVGAVSGSLLESAEVTKVTVSGTITGTSRVGGLVGLLSATGPTSQAAVAVAGPTVSEAASDVTVSGEQMVGGMVGDALDGTITKAATKGTMTGQSYVGGVVGRTSSMTLSDLAADVSVTATQYDAGGVVGYAQGETALSDSAATGTATSPSAAGGLVGSISGTSTITDTAADVSVVGQYAAGGLLGRAFDYPTLTRSVAAGAVSGNVDVGGLVGSALYGAITVLDTAASGAVTGTTRVGGLAGGFTGSLKRSSASGSVTATADDAGGLVGAFIPASGVCGSAVCAATPAPDVPTEIRTSYATGNVRANSRVGGLVGLMADNVLCPISEQVQICAATVVEPEAVVYDSYSTGDVTATDVAGGVVGSTGPLRNESVNDAEVAVTPVRLTVANTYTSGVVTGGTRGGILGEDPGAATVIESFWDATANPGLTGTKGDAKTQTQLRDITTFTKAQWLIQAGAPASGNKLWGICVPADTSVSAGYPFLLWQHDSIDPCHPVPAAPVLKSLTSGNKSLAVKAQLGADGGKPVTQVQYKLDNGEWTNSGGTSGSFTISGLTNGKTYKVRVRAVNAIGASTASNELSGTPMGNTVLAVNALPKGDDLPVDERSVLVRSVRTNGQVLVTRVFCTLKGNRLPKRLRERLCDPTVSGSAATAASRGVAAAKVRKKKVRITATPACSTGLKVHVTIAAKAKGATRKVFTRTYKVDNKPRVKCRIRGTG